MTGRGDYIDATDVTVEELRTALFEKSGRWSTPTALALLLTKDYPQKASDLQRVLEAQDDRLAVMAAAHLGRLGESEALPALTRAAARRGAVARRAAMRSLAIDGPEEAGTLLREVANSAEGEQDRSTAGWNVQLHALRFGQPLEQRVIAKDVDTFDVLEAGAEPVLVESLGRRELDGVLDGLGRSAPLLKVADRSGQQLRCGKQTYAVLLAADMVEEAPERVLVAPRVLAVILHHDDLEVDDWYLRHLVVSQPAGDRTTGLAVVDLDGRPVLAGGVRADDVLRFDLRAVVRPGAVAVSCAGGVVDGQIRFERFYSEQRVRRTDERMSPLRLTEDRG